MLDEGSNYGGLGFCGDVLPHLLPPGHHGPLVLALDTNVLLDLQLHGGALVNNTKPVTGDPAHATQLAGLADVLSLWMLRDIRFVVTASALEEAAETTAPAGVARLPSVTAVAEGVAHRLDPPPRGTSSKGGLRTSPGGRRDQEQRRGEAEALGAHVLLCSRQAPYLRAVKEGPSVKVMTTAELAAYLSDADVQPLWGGVCGHAGCPYGDGCPPAPDTAKWGRLLRLFQ